MKVITSDLDSAPKVPFNLNGKILYSSGKLEMVHLTLNPGEKIDPHIQCFDVIFYVLSGEGNLHTGDEILTGNQNNAIFVPAGILRGWENTGNSEFKVLVIKDLA